MALKVIVTGLVLGLVTIFSIGATGQSDCSQTIITMASCLNFIQGTTPTPPSSCCTALANVVQTDPRCLCQVLSGGAQLGITFNKTLALSLPGACNIQTPPVSECQQGGLAPAPGPGGLSGSNATPGSDSSSATAVAASNEIYLQVVGLLVMLVSFLRFKS